MTRKALLTLILGVILFLAHPAHAQFIGDRMRITTENGEELIGRMKGYDSHSLTIFTNSTEQSIAYADMVRLQRSLGVRSYYREGAKMGLGVAAFLSISAAVAQGDPFAALIATSLGGGVGGLTGLIAGATIRRERWKPLDIPDQDATSIMPVIGVHSTSRLAFANRMRITTEHGENLMGLMKVYDAYSLTIFTDSTEISIAYTDMARLQRSLGVHSYFLEGIVVGLAAGALVGIVSVAGDKENTEEYHSWGAALGDALADLYEIGAWTTGSGLLGLIVGIAIRTEKWELLEIPGQSAASVTPVIGVQPNGRLALGARISF
ncbi:MAG: hypothetical protein F4Y00_01875 [Bacteroidetes bacterium SB0662_bin_6]|nr:hypothetical protein [Bacteroidetes bacterium SB0668_bin_1]MYE03712.1 hypothetical protein [Bacteroidetes bacterium SB0662_bin_6]